MVLPALLHPPLDGAAILAGEEVELVLLLDRPYVVQTQGRLQRTDKGASLGVSGDTRDTRDTITTTTTITAAVASLDQTWGFRPGGSGPGVQTRPRSHLQLKYWTPSWLPSCFPLLGWSHSSPSHTPEGGPRMVGQRPEGDP